MKPRNLVLVLVGVLSLSGCLVDTGPHARTSREAVRGCPPAHHWEGGECVHNGRALGHDHDHDHDHGHDKHH